METGNIIFGLTNILVGGLLLALSIPLIKGKVKMNALYGVRYKKSFECVGILTLSNKKTSVGVEVIPRGRPYILCPTACEDHREVRHANGRNQNQSAA